MINLEIIYKSVLALIIGLALWAGYHHIKQIGYDEARDHYEEVIRDYNEQMARRISEVEKASNILANNSANSTEELKKSLSKILKGQKQKPLVVIKDGKCNPSQEFSNSFFLINSRVNQTIRESQK